MEQQQPKRRNYENHALFRLRQRFKIDASHSDLVALKAMCRGWQGELIGLNGAREIHELSYRQRRMLVVYERASDEIVTVLHPHMTAW